MLRLFVAFFAIFLLASCGEVNGFRNVGVGGEGLGNQAGEGAESPEPGEGKGEDPGGQENGDESSDDDSSDDDSSDDGEYADTDDCKDVRAMSKDSQVVVCRTPDGNPDNRHNVTVSQPGAVTLVCHLGDPLGPCQ